MVADRVPFSQSVAKAVTYVLLMKRRAAFRIRAACIVMEVGSSRRR